MCSHVSVWGALPTCDSWKKPRSPCTRKTPLQLQQQWPQQGSQQQARAAKAAAGSQKTYRVACTFQIPELTVSNSLQLEWNGRSLCNLFRLPRPRKRTFMKIRCGHHRQKLTDIASNVYPRLSGMPACLCADMPTGNYNVWYGNKIE